MIKNEYYAYVFTLDKYNRQLDTKYIIKHIFSSMKNLNSAPVNQTNRFLKNSKYILGYY